MRDGLSQFSFFFQILCLLLIVQVYGDENDVIEEEPNGPIDFTDAEEQPDGSLCVIKTKYIMKMEKQPVKECWQDNVTQCHETYVTEFRPQQEQKCDENFWKACKITFKETNFNYTLQTCMTPLVKKCDAPQQKYGAEPPKEVCKTWFESVCNTTYNDPRAEEEGREAKPQTWCEKMPRKICAPDNCKMEPGEEICHDKTLQSTVQKPEEVCDLQPSTHCRLVTNLVPHLESQTVCKDIPKEICHLKLDHPKMVRKPIKLKWCTKVNNDNQEEAAAAAVPSYLPPSTPEAAAPSQQYGSYQQGPAPQPYQSYGRRPQRTPSPSAYPSPAPASTPAAEGPTSSPVYYKPYGQARL